MTDINEQLVVEVGFRGGVVTPKRLFWRGRDIEVARVTARYEMVGGDAAAMCFSLLSQTALYGVAWNRKTNVWRLLSVEYQLADE